MGWLSWFSKKPRHHHEWAMVSAANVIWKFQEYEEIKTEVLSQCVGCGLFMQDEFDGFHADQLNKSAVPTKKVSPVS